jgi:hypothetical protein
MLVDLPVLGIDSLDYEYTVMNTLGVWVVELNRHPNPNINFAVSRALIDLMSSRLGRRKPGCY